MRAFDIFRKEEETGAQVARCPLMRSRYEFSSTNVFVSKISIQKVFSIRFLQWHMPSHS